MRKTMLLLAAAVLALFALAAAPGGASAGGIACPPESSSTGSVFVPERSADVTILDNGDVRYVETWVVDFNGSGFRFGFRSIPLNRAEDIVDWSVTEGSTVYTNEAYGEYVYNVHGGSGERTVYWCFPATSNETRTFTLSYTVSGSIAIYDDVDQYFWKIIEADHPYTIQRSTVTLHLPAGFSADQLELAAFVSGRENLQIIGQGGGDGGTLTGQSNVRILDPRTLEFSGGPFNAGVEWEIGVNFPHGFLNAEPPSWQFLEDNQAFFSLAVLCVSGIVILLSALGLYLFWYTRGRDRPSGVSLDFMPKPPEPLPPGIVGVLVDEMADMEDITATLVDLARRGYLQIVELDAPGFGKKADFNFIREDRDVSGLMGYEKQLIKGLFSNRRERKLSNMKNKFYRSLPKIREQMYLQVTRRGFFNGNPEKVRQSYGCAAAVLIGVLGVVAFGVYSLATAFTIEPLAVFLGASFLVFPVGLLIAARYMPRKTELGARSAAQWKAFKRYLENIQKYTSVAEATDQFEQYLPYAIAFGIEKSWVRKFAQVETAQPVLMPTWYRPYSPTMTTSGGGSRRGSARPTPSGGGAPSLDDAAGRMFGGLESMSTGLFSMLDQAASTFRSQPSSSGSGGGFSGGGFSGGGGGGGGSSGFG